MTKKIKIAIIDNDTDTLHELEKSLNEEYNVETTEDSEHALEAIDRFKPDIAILDIDIPGHDGLHILKLIKNAFPDLFVIIVTASQDINIAVRAMKLGAYEYLSKPVNIEMIQTIIDKAKSIYDLQHEVDFLKNRIRRKEVFNNIIGESNEIRHVFDDSAKVMDKDVNVLILGESGTGKELLARAIHNGSKRNKGPFVVINCAAITTDLADSLLFGHKKGSFTGAFTDHTGYFQQANDGTIFLDEIGDMNIDVQAKVLRVLEDKKIRKVGDNKEIGVNFRIVSATNRNFKEIITNNEFRNDLYYRLEEYPLTIPPLRVRKDDITLLARHFLREFCIFYEIDYMKFDDSVLENLQKYNWPGNIRSLKM